MTDFDFHHGVSDAFLDHLDHLAGQPSWWRDVLLHDDLFVAVRRNYLNVYHRGGSIFRIDDRGDGTVSPKTHVKYLVRQQQALAELVDGKFKSKPIVWTDYDGRETLRHMIRAASDLAGAEKTGLHPMIMGSAAVIDVEVALKRADGGAMTESTTDETGTPATTVNRSQDRLDVATLERQGDKIAVAFHEAKHFTNPALRARSGPPAVIGQLRSYRSTLTDQDSALIERYQATCRALVRFDAMRRHVRPDAKPTSQLVHEVATGKAILKIDCDPRLIIFGFDADQKEGQLEAIKTALKKAADWNLEIYAAGDPASAGGAFQSKNRDKKFTPNLSS
jgi:hypothetical protein